MKFLKSSFGKRPKGLDPVNVILSQGKFILTMLNPKMFLIPYINKTVISSPRVRVNHAIGVNFTSYNTLERLFRTIWDHFGIHFTASLKDAKDWRLTIGTSSTFPGYPPKFDRGVAGIY